MMGNVPVSWAQLTGGLSLPQGRDVRILKFLSPRQSADCDQGSAVSLRPQQERNIGSTSALNRLASGGRWHLIISQKISTESRIDV